MNPLNSSTRLFVALTLLSAVLLVGCQGGQISIDLNGDGGSGGGGDAGGTVANQTLFILMVVLLVAMFAMVLVAMSSR
ncbi:MAG TPA: hypothetical protein VI703_01855 [Anaerolineales bacterium]|jgi:hypothetical protein|nr:hypothetical protein [Anaerolineales bacterium]